MISLSAGVLTVVLGLSSSPKIVRVGLEFESKNWPSRTRVRVQKLSESDSSLSPKIVRVQMGRESSRMKTVWFVGILTLFYSLQLECNGNLNM